MKEEYLHNYFESFQSVIQSIGINEVQFTPTHKRDRAYSDHHICIIIGFVGDIRGQTEFIMGKDVALWLTSILAGGMEITEIDELVKSAMGEFANMVMGNSCTLFSKQGVSLDITPPAIVTGDNFHISNLSNTYYNNIAVENIGELYLDISLKD